MSESSSIVLYVEDEEGDRLLAQIAFEREKLGQALRTVSDGRKAIAYLSGAGPYGEREKYPLPRVVLLDLKLPEMHGFEVLQWIRAQPAHRDLPVVVFTSSALEEDRRRARELGANDVVQKSGSLVSLQALARKLAAWDGA